MTKKNNTGFTLIEMLVVIAIIATIAAFALPAITGAMTRGQLTQAVSNARQRFQRLEGILRVVGPEATLRRGYSITTDEGGKLIRTVATVRPKMKIHTRVSDGEFGSTTTER